MVPVSSQGALGTSQRGLVAPLGRPNCRLEGSWGALGSSSGPLGGLGTSLPSFLEALRLPRATFSRHVVAQRRVRNENGEKLDVDDLENEHAMIPKAPK